MKQAVIIGVIAVAVIGAGIALFSYDVKHPELQNPWANKSTRDLALTCLDQEYTVMHIHPVLTITLDGQKQNIPSDIGIEGVSGDVSHEQAQSSASCLHPIHTHDAAGTIHVESPEQRDYVLGDFFAVWGKAFSKNEILDRKADATHRIRMTVNGQESTDFENLVLKDKDDIQIFYEEIK